MNNKMNEPDKILRYEEIALNAFPAKLTEVFDGWILRYSNGYTYRANSVNPIYPSKYDLSYKIGECEKKYFSRSLPCIFKMTKSVENNLDELLENRGYEMTKKAYVMEMLLPHNYSDNPEKVICSSTIEEKWLEEFVVLNGTIENPDKTTIKDMLRTIGNPLVCAAIYENNEMAACGLGVYEDEKIGLFDIRVLEKYRRKGYGKMICRKIIYDGTKMGANKAYLQVAASNNIAIDMYKKLGFKKIYEYWYRSLAK